MKIVVLSGSPKGVLSTTLHYVLYLRERMPEHDFEIVHVCEEHEAIEDDPARFDSILDGIRAADGVLWVYPIYTFLIHAHLKRFIELVFACSAGDAFKGKYAAALTTSIHFFDHTAHNYIHGICDDLGMRYVGEFSAEVYDLLTERGKTQLMLFARDFLNAIAKRVPTARVFDPVVHHPIEYAPGPPATRADLDGRRMVILTDCDDDRSNLAKMTARFRQCFVDPPEIVNLHALGIRTGCDGCFQCGERGICVYREADDVHDLYLSTLDTADVVVMAGTIVDRYLSSRWKLFFDRGFFRPVIPWFSGKQLAFLVSGPLKQLPNLRQILVGYSEFHRANLAGIVTDECDDSSDLDGLVDALAEQIAFCAKNGYHRPRTFLGVGGMKIFRDETWGFLRPVFQVAHRHYKKHRLYDFPQYNLRTRMLAVAGMLLTRLPGVRKKFFRSLRQDIVRPLQKEVAKAGEVSPKE